MNQKINNGLIRQEIKICLPAYKAACALCFIILLSLVRGISMTDEIGITLDAYMPVLAIVLCADSYQMEYTAKRWEVFCLYSIRNRKKAVFRRLAVQCVYLWALSAAGYFCFYWQRPRHNIPQISPGFLFGISIFAVCISIALWGTAAMAIAILFRNTWSGIGLSVVLWTALNSKKSAELLEEYNVFSFAFRDTARPDDWGWLYGKGISVILLLLMAAAVPFILKKRG